MYRFDLECDKRVTRRQQEPKQKEAKLTTVLRLRLRDVDGRHAGRARTDVHRYRLRHPAKIFRFLRAKQK